MNDQRPHVSLVNFRDKFFSCAGYGDSIYYPGMYYLKVSCATPPPPPPPPL